MRHIPHYETEHTNETQLETGAIEIEKHIDTGRLAGERVIIVIWTSFI